jgi:hypothetical protein
MLNVYGKKICDDVSEAAIKKLDKLGCESLSVAAKDGLEIYKKIMGDYHRARMEDRQHMAEMRETIEELRRRLEEREVKR